MNHATHIVLKGRINIELIPSAKWRELAPLGVATMSYAISGKAVIEEQERSVNIKIPALDSGVLKGLGTGKPWGTGEETEIITGFFPKNPKAVNGLDTVILATDNENKVQIDEDGMPVYAEGPIIITEGEHAGEEFNLFYGTHFYCPIKGGLTLEFTDLGCTETDREDENMLPWIDCSFTEYRVVSAKSTRAKGTAMNIVCRAARSTTRTVPQTAKQIAEPAIDQPAEV